MLRREWQKVRIYIFSRTEMKKKRVETAKLIFTIRDTAI